MSVGLGGNYISDGALLTWLANQQDRIYGDLKESMDLSERRADATSALGDIKLHLEEANRSKDFSQVDEELQAFLAEYGSDPQFAELTQTVGEISRTVHANWQYASHGYPEEVKAYEAKLERYNQGVDDAAYATARGSLQDSSIERQEPVPPEEPTFKYSDETIDGWLNAIDTKLDVSSKNDQLTMIHIQELKSTLDQGTQLASTLIAGSDKSLDAVINNIA